MFAVLAALSLAVQSAPAPDSAPEPDPNPGPNPGLDFTEACGTIEAAIGSGTIPGAVFVVGPAAPTSCTAPPTASVRRGCP